MNDNLSEKDAICYLEALKDAIRGKYKNDDKIIASIDMGIQRIKDTMVPTAENFEPWPNDSNDGFVDF